MAKFFTAGRIARVVLSLVVAFLVIWPIVLYARHFLVR